MRAGPGLIALTGVSGAGKDGAGDYLARHHGYVRIAIADPLKVAVMSLFGLDRDQLWGSGRNRIDPRLGRAPRDIYQQFGRVCRDIDPDVWIRPFRRAVVDALGRGERVVCTDVRTPAELAGVRALGGAVWRIERPGSGAPGAMALDATETELGRAPVEAFDAVIRNDGCLADLHLAVERILRAA